MSQIIDNIPQGGGSSSIPIELKGQALQIVLQLKGLMRDVRTESDVIVHAIALLNRARKKEIHIVDPNSGDVEIVNPWK
jgi:hypothetical protein